MYIISYSVFIVMSSMQLEISDVAEREMKETYSIYKRKGQYEKSSSD